MITREEALGLLEENLSNHNLIKHSLASEAVLRALASRLGENEEEWGLAGLLHDLDAQIASPQEHGLKTVAILGEKINPAMAQAIKSHNQPFNGIKRETKFDNALAAGETITGLIVAATLVLPSKKLADLKLASVLKRFEEKHFAAGARREDIALCEKLGLSLEEFADLALKAMQGISEELGL
ncbi:HD domain-containing protein [Candidatus Shapirobacteria bacterium]|nr:HD domain-containing protein [Candidatus Shapirobacteria bacterium]